MIYHVFIPLYDKHLNYLIITLFSKYQKKQTQYNHIYISIYLKQITQHANYKNTHPFFYLLPNFLNPQIGLKSIVRLKCNIQLIEELCRLNEIRPEADRVPVDK